MSKTEKFLQVLTQMNDALNSRKDSKKGGTRNDTLAAGADKFDDYLNGEDGHDTFYGFTDNCCRDGDLGNDLIYPRYDDNTLAGSASFDTLSNDNLMFFWCKYVFLS